MQLLTLFALGLMISAAAIGTLWFWQQRREAGVPIAALWPALVGGLAVLYASQGDGAWMRRSAIGWMMGSWGARLAIQGLYTRASNPPGNVDAMRPPWVFPVLTAAAAIASVPALLVAFNRDPELSLLELSACAMWVIGFTGETTADRQRLRFSSKPEHNGLPCRSGLWRYSPMADRIFEGIIWIAYLTFGAAAL
jgi:steroid 5-alpha reductase family enzyme